MSGMSNAELLEAALSGSLDDDGNITAHATEGAAEAQEASQQEPTEQPAVESKDSTPPQTDNADEEQEAPIQSKSGAYTIPYQKLVDARTERDSLRDQVAQLQQHLAGKSIQRQANLAQDEAQGRADAGARQTQADQNLGVAEQALADGADIAVFGDFSEAAIAKGVAEVNRRAIAQVRAEMQSLVQQAVAPLQQREAQSAQSAHEAAILQAHPDAKEITESQEFAAWLDGLPAFARSGVGGALAEGTAQQIVEVFSAFRAAGTPTPQQQIATQKVAPEAPKARVPISLSEVPGAAPVDETQQTLALAANSGALLDRMASMSSDQIDALMNRI